MNARSLSVWLSGSALILAGGLTSVARPPADGPPVVLVHVPVERVVTDCQEFTGRTDAQHHVELRARVTGYLVKAPFKEGDEVKKGDLLFEIDARPYQAEVDVAQGKLTLAEATLKAAKATLE